MQPKLAIWLFFVAGLLFLLVAVIPVLRGDGLNSTFFVLAIVFLILGLANLKKRRNGDGPPSA